eukprot:s3919_g11.t1
MLEAPSGTSPPDRCQAPILMRDRLTGDNTARLSPSLSDSRGLAEHTFVCGNKHAGDNAAWMSPSLSDQVVTQTASAAITLAVATDPRDLRRAFPAQAPAASRRE